MFNRNATVTHEDTTWISISDLMSGLMIIFLFIAIVFMLELEQDRAKSMETLVEYTNIKEQILADLHAEFDDDLSKWNARIDESLTVEFLDPEVLFTSGGSRVKVQYKEILADFFPRYVNIVLKRYSDNVSYVAIEGHTSTRWGTADVTTAFFNNMALSQNRALAVYRYVALLDVEEFNWLTKNIVATGYSSSKPVLIDGIESPELSRRVVFKVVTKSEETITKLTENAS